MSADTDARGSRVFRWIAPAFAAAGVFHAAALVKPEIAEPVPPWWHALFVGVNVIMAVGVVKRPRGFLAFYVAYTVQQFVEHGARGVRVWRDEHRFDWASFVSLVFVPFVLALLIRDASGKRQANVGAA